MRNIVDPKTLHGRLSHEREGHQADESGSQASVVRESFWATNEKSQKQPRSVFLDMFVLRDRLRAEEVVEVPSSPPPHVPVAVEDESPAGLQSGRIENP